MLSAGTAERHYARTYRMRQKETKQNKTNTRKKVNVVHPKKLWSSSEGESGEKVEVMHIDNMEMFANKPLVLKWTFNRKLFRALIDTGSPVTIFTKAHIQKMFGKDYKLRPLEKNEKFSAAKKSISSEPSSGKSSRERES